MAAAKKTGTEPQDNDNGNEAQGGETQGTGEAKRKGRPPNKIYFTCAALKNMPKRDADGNVIKEAGKTVTEPTLVMGEYEVPSVAEREVAFEKFKDEHGIKVQGCKGPYYIAKAVAKSAENKVYVNIPLNKIKMSGKIWEAVYEGWSVVAHGLNAVKDEKNKLDFNENDVVLMFIGEKVNKDEETPRPRFGSKPATVLRTALENAKLVG
jgi:hypothetical protein